MLSSLTRQTGRISIHALREEGDRRQAVLDPHRPHISIHALREEGDPLEPES